MHWIDISFVVKLHDIYKQKKKKKKNMYLIFYKPQKLYQ